VVGFKSDCTISNLNIYIYSDVSLKKEILFFSRELNADVFALSMYGRSGLFHLLVESITKNLSKMH